MVLFSVHFGRFADPPFENYHDNIIPVRIWKMLASKSNRESTGNVASSRLLKAKEAFRALIWDLYPLSLTASLFAASPAQSR